MRFKSERVFKALQLMSAYNREISVIPKFNADELPGHMTMNSPANKQIVIFFIIAVSSAALAHS